MIRYNLRYRGPFEYDKMILNILQLYNEVKYLQQSIEDGELNLFNEKNNNLKELFNSLTAEKGMLSDILKLRLKIEESVASND